MYATTVPFWIVADVVRAVVAGVGRKAGSAKIPKATGKWSRWRTVGTRQGRAEDSRAGLQVRRDDAKAPPRSNIATTVFLLARFGC